VATRDIVKDGDKPYYKDIEWVEMKLSSHNRVTALKQVGTSGQLLSITRDRGDVLLVWLSDVYTLGEAEYLHIRKLSPDINCILKVSGYTHYTPEAKEQAVQDRIGLFSFGELMGALNVEKFWSYVAPSQDRSPSSRPSRGSTRRKRGNT
jgi:hypothetical protein